MKVRNMTSNRWGSEERVIPNQFIITDDQGNQYFQSYNTIIVKRTLENGERKVYLDNDWAYSVTTGKYRNQFLGETRRETEAKIKDGTYIVTDLNS